MITRTPGRMSKRTARARFIATQRTVEWAILPSGYDVIEVGDHRGWRAYTNSIDTARRRFGLQVSTSAVVA